VERDEATFYGSHSPDQKPNLQTLGKEEEKEFFVTTMNLDACLPANGNQHF
jgi:hypothetical protein